MRASRRSRDARRASTALLLASLPLAAISAGAADADLIELATPVAELELAAVPDTDRLCAAGALVGIRLREESRVSLSIAGEIASGTVDGGRGRPLDGVTLAGGPHRLVLSAEPRGDTALGERAFEVTAVASNGAASATVHGVLRDERIDRPVLDIGHTFVRGVDLLDGHLVLRATDIDLAGRHIGLALTRTYSSAGRSRAGFVGAGWRLSYESSFTLIEECGLALVHTSDGSTQSFLASGDDDSSYRPQRGYHTRLEALPDGSFEFVDKSDTRHHFAGPAAGTASSLRLAWIEEPHGDRALLDYDDRGRLERVSEWHPLLGPIRTLSFTWRDVGGVPRLAEARAWGLGIRVRYRQDDLGNLIAVERIDREAGSSHDSYSYDTADPWDPHRLSSLAPDGEAPSRYEYGTPGGTSCSSLAASTDRRELVAAVYESPGDVATAFCYDHTDSARGVFRAQVSYGAGGADQYVLNRDGNPVTIESSGEVTRLTWDPEHVVKTTEEHEDGRRLEFAYDASGNLTRETERAGPGEPAQTTSYTYDPRFNKLVRKEAPDGQVSEWTLDPGTGDLLRQTEGGVTTTWRYDSHGCLREKTDAEGTTRYLRPDTFCNATEIRTPDGAVIRRRYDARGRLNDETETPPR